MNKSPDAFRTISEVAEQLDVPAHVLRFWETRFSQVKPVKRGGGRRYYRPDDVRLLRGIRSLLYDNGMTIKGVQKILRDHGVRHVIGLGTVEETEALIPPVWATVTIPTPAPAPASVEPALAAAGESEPKRLLRTGVSLDSNGRERPRASFSLADSDGERREATASGAFEYSASADSFAVDVEDGALTATPKNNQTSPELDVEDAALQPRDEPVPTKPVPDDVTTPVARKVDRNALRLLVGELEALRAVMAGKRA
jgi:DNA-binding transcriptional MerR regulator